MSTPSPASAARAAFDAALAAALSGRYGASQTLPESVRYVLAGDGKRVRPVLCLLAAEAVGGVCAAALPAALAIEMIHTYSLVHDDLPCMDDDDLRRGRPTAHKVFGEANALLAGDALLTDAFALLAEAEGLSPTVRVALVRELAAAAGGNGMVLGQSLDLHWTGRGGASRAVLDDLHTRKTGYLLGAAAAMGALAGGAPDAVVARLRAAGRAAGLAFQVVDDLLDEAAGTGKSAGKDRAAGKLTYLALMSPAEARAAAEAATARALAELAGLGVAGEPLRAVIAGLVRRQS